MSMTIYTIYASNQWKLNNEWPNGLEPDGYGNRRKIGIAVTESSAREICTEWNSKHKPGKLCRRASYTSSYKKQKQK